MKKPDHEFTPVAASQVQAVAQDCIARTPLRESNRGWFLYPHPVKNGRFHEDLRVIEAILGSTLYEAKGDTRVFIRRIQD